VRGNLDRRWWFLEAQWMDGRMDGWMDGWMGGWIGGVVSMVLYGGAVWMVGMYDRYHRN